MLTGVKSQKIPVEQPLSVDEGVVEDLKRQIREGQAIEALQGSPAWQVLRGMLVARHTRAMSELKTCGAQDLVRLQIRVDEIENLLKAVDAAVSDGREALDRLAQMESESNG